MISRPSRRTTRIRRKSSRRYARCSRISIFSFYYREMLKARVAGDTQAGCAEHARFAAAEIPRPRAGELGDNPRRDGNRRTLHYMTEKPDNGDIVAQQAVPILPNDTALAGVPESDGGGGDGVERRACRICWQGGASGEAGFEQGRIFRRTQGGRRHHRLVAVGAGRYTIWCARWRRRIRVRRRS